MPRPWYALPLTRFKDYFGEKQGLACALVVHLAHAFVYLLVLGVVVQIDQLARDDVAVWTVAVYALVVVLWGVLVTEYWKRHERELALERFPGLIFVATFDARLPRFASSPHPDAGFFGGRGPSSSSSETSGSADFVLDGDTVSSSSRSFAALCSRAAPPRRPGISTLYFFNCFVWLA